MKVCILGPVQTKSYYGGVALFDEELGIGFAKNNCDVIIATNQKDAIDRQLSEKVCIKKVSKASFRSYLKTEKPNIIIASLGYAALLPKRSMGYIAVYFLHGFFNESYYGKCKSMVASLYQKHLIHRVNYVFANSYFTSMVNHEFFGILTDKVFHLAVSESVFQQSKGSTAKDKRANSILFAGRLVSAKGTRLIIEAAKMLLDRGIEYELTIAGDGPDKNWMEEQARIFNLPMHFPGRVSQTEIAKLYRESEVFVSLNPSEPFGITYLEALLNNCKIVCPYTGGQVEFLQSMPERVEFVSGSEANAVTEAITSLLNRKGVQLIPDTIREKYEYSFVAERMLDYLAQHSSSKITL